MGKARFVKLELLIAAAAGVAGWVVGFVAMATITFGLSFLLKAVWKLIKLIRSATPEEGMRQRNGESNQDSTF
jgi:hypothetical protein